MIATQSPASGPNSGPTTIAPTIRIGEPRKIPTEAIRQARAMKTRNMPPSSVLSEVRASTSSQITASEGAPLAARSARSAASEICESICSIEIEPSPRHPELLQVLDHDARVLAGDVAEDDVARGLPRRALQRGSGCRPRARLRAGRAPSGQVMRDDDPQVDHGSGAYPRPASPRLTPC